MGHTALAVWSSTNFAFILITVINFPWAALVAPSSLGASRVANLRFASPNFWWAKGPHKNWDRYYKNYNRQLEIGNGPDFLRPLPDGSGLTLAE
uniref:Uncharacterized protein n=1 Tax=Rhizoctonia solani TaxID=456999 RepID=N0ACS5_9AGAM|nr:hypothetical protein RSOL_m00530 [Rhizoctonia solani]AGK45387.1 hypothetical protein RSOL_m00530 [Rhizoctonia solani]